MAQAAVVVESLAMVAMRQEQMAERVVSAAAVAVAAVVVAAAMASFTSFTKENHERFYL
jgi:hypothetical protein